MSVYQVLELWWVVPTGLALLGYALAFAGLSRAQRAVWVTARIVRLARPAHGGSKDPGIPVALRFRDPSTRQDFVLPNTGKHGDVLKQAWVGREVAVRYPQGRPHAFRIVLDAAGERDGRLGPNCAVLLLMIGLVVHLTVVRGYPWALLGFGALLAALAVASPDIRLARTRDALLASAEAVPARVVAVTKDVGRDGEGSEIVNHAPRRRLHHARGNPRHRPGAPRHPSPGPLPRARAHHALRPLRPGCLHTGPGGRPPRQRGSGQDDRPHVRRRSDGSRERPRAALTAGGREPRRVGPWSDDRRPALAPRQRRVRTSR
ncbi:hypothetical protein OG206_02320 [Streptomyces sp. NBC_01341]|uniref:hypothetical protein n=1 Tax=Streptomyces sp. NBC_01341 TaxID=2903831 RepID=UPI002E141F0D|nr:hypothetical protein OG206_02320 [Streptomyces sp. NBC_01341]